MDPNTLTRTHTIEGKNSTRRVENIADDMRTNGYNSSEPIDVVVHEDNIYIVDGHHRAAAARRTGTPVDINIIPHDQLPNHHSSYNSIDDVVNSANSVTGADRLTPRGRR